jgi:hypothetical protein
MNVLRLHCLQRFGRRHVETGQLERVEPDAHGVFSAKQGGLAYTRHAAQILQYVGGGKTAQVEGIAALIGGINSEKHQKIAPRFGDGDALSAHFFRQSRFNAFDPVLRFHRCNIEIGAGRESQRQREGAGGVAARFEIEQMLQPVHFLLDQRGHRILHNFRTSAWIDSGDCQGGRGDIGILRNR